MFKKVWLLCPFFLLPYKAMAQPVPNAGGQMQQIPSVPVRPGPNALPELLLQQPAIKKIAPEPQASTFIATQLQVIGSSIYTEPELVKMTGFVSGHEVTLKALSDMADLITQRYRRDGYFVARAYLPAQTIQDGRVTIAVLEGQYDKVSINNTSTLDPKLPQDLLSGLNKGDIIAIDPLEERLLQLSDVPGVQVRASLVPGASVGLSDLIVEVKPGVRFNGSIDADNAGSRYTGENRLGATLNLNNPTGNGDLITLRGLTSGTGLQYVRAAYQTPIGKGRVGIAYSDLNYTLGREFQTLDANGHARISSLFASYPVVRSRDTKVNVGLTLDSKTMQDRTNAIASVSDKRAQVATTTLYGDHRDTWGLGGLSSYSLAWTSGNLNLQTPTVRTQDANTANANGTFQKMAFSASRLQQTSLNGISLFASLSGQVASKNLDVSEKMELGGMYGVRAYPEGEAYADEGYLLTLEARKQLALQVKGQLQAAAFIDAGAVTLSHTPWSSTGNTRHLSGAGAGLYWTRSNNFSIRVLYARKLGNGVALSAPDKPGRFWVQAVTYF